MFPFRNIARKCGLLAGGRYLHFEAEINQAFQVLETRLPLSDYILAHNTF